jgi:hypothetical protein
MKVGPNISQSGLVFGIDVGNHRYFPGEPTTNLLSDPPLNAIPKSGNSWGTYNTNQYGSGNFFSIGTVSSVSNNIVTMSLAHSLRTYDVMRPQTTGGGVTANTDYFIKRVSSTQFSLHAYNNSQDGSQGYINPSTGLHKVHDSIANDTRISISSESFPTMWWGAPHLPNAGLVKESIANGFTNPLTGEVTDCLRQHITRDSGADHMAYNVNASFTANSPVYCSFWARAVDSAAVGKSINYYHYTYGVQSPTAYSVGCTLGAVGQWQRYGYTWTSPNNNAISYWFNPDGPYKYDIANIQVEQKDHPTRFTTGTRSSTQSVLDITRNTTINVSNVSFDSNGFMTFDGTDDYFDIPNPSLISGTQDFTIETVYNMTGQNGGEIFGNYGPGYTSNSIWFSGQYGFYLNGACYAPGAPIANGKYHMVATRLNGTVKLYLNGTEVNSVVLNASVASNINYRVGRDVNSSAEPFTGTIYTLRIYNRALSSLDVAQNYNSYKKRFNI